MTTNVPHLLAKRFVERAEALEMKGKKRDCAALDYFCGATTAAELSEQPALAAQLASICVLIISIRGYKGVLELANGEI